MTTTPEFLDLPKGAPRLFEGLSLSLVKEAKAERGKVRPAIVKGIRRTVFDAVRRRDGSVIVSDLGPNISKEITKAVLGEDTVISAFAAGQIRDDLRIRGIRVSDAQAGDIFHKALIAGAVGGAALTVAAAVVSRRGQLPRIGPFVSELPVGVTAGTAAEVFETGLVLPLVREHRRRAQTLMGVCVKCKAVERNKLGQIIGVARQLKPLLARIQKARQANKQDLVKSLRKTFIEKARQIGKASIERQRKK